jgi:hypothetical protein
MKRISVLTLSTALAALAAVVGLTAAGAQTDTTVSAPPTTLPAATAAPVPVAPPGVAPVPGAAPVAVPPAPVAPAGPPPNAVLQLKALDKITGKASIILASLNKPVKFATLTITARTCYSTPPSETPETSAFLQISDHRPDQPERRWFSGWMYASSPGLNSLQHPIYDVWVISCMTNAPGKQPAVVAVAPVKAVSPNAGANEAMPTLPADAGQ